MKPGFQQAGTESAGSPHPALARTLVLRQPEVVALGEGSALECPAYLRSRSLRRLLLVSSASAGAALAPLRQALASEGIDVVDAPPVGPEPAAEDFAPWLERVRGEDFDSVAGAGGGSVLDVAKLAAALARSPQPLQEAYGIGRLAGRALPLLCLPTTAGTGAEASPNAILLDRACAMKRAVISPHLVPDAAFVDPLLGRTVPPPVTAASGLDALTHCIEVYVNLQAHPLVDIVALEGIRLIGRHLLRAVRDGHDREARSAMALGSYYGGLGLGPVNTAAVHALAYPLGGRFGVPHGAANGLLLPHVLRFNLPAAPGRHARVAEMLGAGHTAEAAADFVEVLVRDCGIPRRLSDWGIPRAELPAMAASALEVVRLLRNNVRPMTAADALQIYEDAY